MKTKLTLMAVLVCVFAAAFSSGAYAAGGGVLTGVKKVNAVMDNEIRTAIYQADAAFAKYMDRVDGVTSRYEKGALTWDEAVLEIQQCEAWYDDRIQKIVGRLYAQTEHQADAMVLAAGNNGVEIVKEYVEIHIAGNVYLVDPLRIVGH